MSRTLSHPAFLSKRDPETPELLADLKTLPDAELTRVGALIKSILLLENATAPFTQNLTYVYTAPGPLASPECRADTCCVWSYVAEEMERDFRGPTGRCNEFARQAIRLGFHDAGTWSKSEGGSGADGSFVLGGEIARPINRGLEEINNKMWAYYHTFHSYGAGMADLVQMGATVAAAVCPQGPRILSFVGRNDSDVPAPEGRLPQATQDAEPLIALFEDKTIDRGDLITLLGAHTIGQQRFEDTARAGDPQSSTPGVWSTDFYRETPRNDTPKRVFKFHSDVEIATFEESLPLWGVFADPVNGLETWNSGYAAVYIRLSVLGVPHINNLVECTGVLPLPVRNYSAPDGAELSEWLNSDRAPMREEAILLMNGESLKGEV
ncbi:class II peroxidase [Lentithecium fluviatile CBS 122367]|uniref:Peroxidase n=1 Tax=Lentithecium fluviatile CBS 122367 TaxID=1168545 RepID=A0A6G1JAM1_9PLEO|nr:class II peroxidase [Lentithecium fluviatile CBS 122367]